MPVFMLSNPCKNYDWGSPFFIPQLLQMEADPKIPVAEMWIGAHPADSSILIEVEGQPSLREYILNHPLEALGKASDLYKGELPFLLKVLAAEKPLSIQVHPSEKKQRKVSSGKISWVYPLTHLPETFVIPIQNLNCFVP